MDYETQMEALAKKKKRNQLLGMLFVVIILLVGAFYFYQWQQGKRKKEFTEMSEEILNYVYDLYKDDKMLDDNMEDKTYTFPDTTVANFNERTLKGGLIHQYKDGTVEFYLHNEKWCAIKKKQSSSIEILDYNADTCIIE